MGAIMGETKTLLSNYGNCPYLYNNEVGFEMISEMDIENIISIFNRHISNDENIAVAICSSYDQFTQPFSYELVGVSSSVTNYYDFLDVPITSTKIYYDAIKEREFYKNSTGVVKALNHGFSFDFKQIGTDWYRIAFDETLQDRDTGICVSFKDLINSDVSVKFSDGFFVLCVFKYNSDSRVFNMVESYILNYDINKKVGGVSYSQILRSVNESSPNIWVALNRNLDSTDDVVISGLQTINTNSSTILSNVIRNDYTTKQLNIKYEQNTISHKASFDELFNRYSDPYYSVGTRYFLPVVRLNTNGSVNLDFSSDLVNLRKNCMTAMTIWDDAQVKLLRNDSDKVNYVLGEMSASSPRVGTAFSNKNSFTVCYDNMKYQTDDFNNRNRWIPLAGDVIGIIDAYDKSINAYDVPAGYQTTRFKNTIKMLYDLKDPKLKNKLATASINIVTKDEAGEWMLFDMQTNITGNSEFRKLNVRRAVIEVKRIIQSYSKTLFFGQNDSTMKTSITRDLNSQIRLIGGLESFRVICDSSNNSSDDENSGIINIDILLVPRNYIRIINIRISLTKNSVGGIVEQEI